MCKSIQSYAEKCKITKLLFYVSNVLFYYNTFLLPYIEFRIRIIK